ncbi:hypothetical protein GEZ98_00905 [Streptococcus mitis]|uniref:Uncharacterized protein n=1 Tax=Streptococcus mitis TaxID=28037 RepID=A0A7X1URF2_STRMT|nr:hypothetical protein [Streptococcus mitis]MQQ01490.1 hypothetical protein [Streptococcus mitis]
MSEILTILSFLIIFLIFSEFKRRKNKKFNDSPFFVIIEKEYKKWHRMNGRILNRKYTTAFEIDRILFELRSKLLGYGITKKEFENYIKFVESKGNQLSFSIKDIIIGLLTFLSTNTLISKILPNPTWEQIQDSLQGLVSSMSGYNYIFNIILILLLFILLIRSMYVISNFDNLNKEGQRFPLLKRLESIWEYKENTEISTTEDALKHRKENTEEYVYTKINFSKSNFDKKLETAIGETVFDNFSFMFQKIETIWTLISGLFDWLLGFIMPTIFLTISFWLLFFEDKNIIYIILSVIVYLLFISFSNSQMNVYSEGITYEKSDFSKKYQYKLVPVRRKWPSIICFAIYLIFSIFIGYYLFVSEKLNCLNIIFLIIFFIVYLTSFFRRVEKVLDDNAIIQ